MAIFDVCYCEMCAELHFKALRLKRQKVRVSSRTSSGGSSPDCRSLEGSRNVRPQKPHAKTVSPRHDAENPCNPGTRGVKSASPITLHVPHAPTPNSLDERRSQLVSEATANLQKEISFLRAELNNAQMTITCFQEREQKLKDRLAEQARKMLERGVRFENIALGERRPTALVRRYGNLYAQARVDTLDSLDTLTPLREADELKSKILFSVVVLAFRSVQNTLSEMRHEVYKTLQVQEKSRHDPISRDLENGIDVYLRQTADSFDISRNMTEVCSQIWTTLFDYPCLKKCDGLLNYVRDCVRLAWCLSNQNPPYVIEYETRAFKRDLHVRFHVSDNESEVIKTYLWPSLLEGENGPCAHKGMVIT